MRGQLYRGYANATAFSSSPVVSAMDLVQWSVHFRFG